MPSQTNHTNFVPIMNTNKINLENLDNKQYSQQV